MQSVQAPVTRPAALRQTVADGDCGPHGQSTATLPVLITHDSP